jgi:hypothetical protein
MADMVNGMWLVPVQRLQQLAQQIRDAAVPTWQALDHELFSDILTDEDLTEAIATLFDARNQQVNRPPDSV